MVASKKAAMNPRAIGELLASTLATKTSVFAGVEIAGPGFVNLRLQPTYISAYLEGILQAGQAGVAQLPPTGEKVNIEFVSVNPNGPITVGSGRGASFGDALSRVFKSAGIEVHKEYYINDGVNSEQMRLFAESVRHFYRQSLGLESVFPDKGYRGEYVQQVAARLMELEGDSQGDAEASWFQSKSQDLMIERQRNDLGLFGVTFDTWFSEQSLHDSGEVLRCVEELKSKGVADEEPYRTKLKLGKGGVVEEVIKEAQTDQMEEDGDEAEGVTVEDSQASSTNKTLWLRSTKFGDDMDRVIRRKDGRLTYIASDIAYHKDKFNRPAGASKLYTVLGPDHHGYIGRLTAVLAALLRKGPDTDENNQEALNEAKAKLDVVIFQLVRFLKDGKPAPMRKRDGNIYELRDLIEELGAAAAPNSSKEEQKIKGRDVARFFYLMRSHDTAMDFDIDLATKQSDDNPVFYVQYAHARICSVIDKAKEAGIQLGDQVNSSVLVHARELALIKKILDLKTEVERISKDHGVHRLTTYAIELARTYHNFYDVCRVVQPDEPELSKARLALCEAARMALSGTLDLLGISAPRRLDREA